MQPEIPIEGLPRVEIIARLANLPTHFAGRPLPAPVG